jgi:hypothetical protein
MTAMSAPANMLSTAATAEKVSTALVLPNEIAVRRALALSESWHDEPLVHLPDVVLDDLKISLTTAIAETEMALTPAHPGEILTALETWATRRGLPMPEGPGLDLDVEAMSSWPRAAFLIAFQRAWERFTYRRIPTAADLRTYIEDDLVAHQR